MRKYLGVGFLLFICAAGWEIGGRLSTDALGLALGVLFGVMAGVPAALIALTASRRSEPQQPARYEQQTGLMPRHMAQHQPPVIILAGAPTQQPWHGQQQGMQYPPQYRQEQPNYNVVDSYAYPVGQSSVQQPAGRQFKLIGEKEELIEDW